MLRCTFLMISMSLMACEQSRDDSDVDVDVDQNNVIVTPWTETMSAGLYAVCWLDANGGVECVGNDDFEQAEPPAGNFTHLELDLTTSCGVRADGEAVCWGSAGEAFDIPSGPWTKVVFGNNHGCGLRDGGAVECWGEDYYGQTDVPVGTWADVSAGPGYSCGLRPTGELVCWGDIEATVAGSPRFEAQPEGRYTRVFSGMGHAACVSSTDNTLLCWGEDDNSQVSGVPNMAFRDVSIGDEHICGITTGNELRCWGSDEYGQTSVPRRHGWNRVAAGWRHTCAEAMDGSMFCWGNNTMGEMDGAEN